MYPYQTLRRGFSFIRTFVNSGSAIGIISVFALVFQHAPLPTSPVDGGGVTAPSPPAGRVGVGAMFKSHCKDTYQSRGHSLQKHARLKPPWYITTSASTWRGSPPSATGVGASDPLRQQARQEPTPTRTIARTLARATRPKHQKGATTGHGSQDNSTQSEEPNDDTEDTHNSTRCRHRWEPKDAHHRSLPHR
jgi:hypothetical protein